MSKVLNKRKHPNWCNYPVSGIDMCWSFMNGYVKDKSFCKDCEFFRGCGVMV